MATTQHHHRYRDYQQQKEDDCWENDFSISLPNNNNHQNIFSSTRKGVFTMDHEKELTLACERYQYPAQHFYLEDEDDTASSVTSGSILSEITTNTKYSELDSALNDIDDFMYDEPPPSTFHSPLITRSITSTPFSFQQQQAQPQVQSLNLGQFPGVVKRLGSVSSHSRYGTGVHHTQHQQPEEDNDDWADDVIMPKNGFSSLNPVKKVYDQQISLFDDGEEDEFEKEAAAPQQPSNRPNLTQPSQQQQQQQQKLNLPTPSNSYRPTTTPSSSSSRPIYHYQVEREEDDDDDMTDLDFPENMAILPKRLDEKKRYNPATAQQQQQTPTITTSRSTRIPISTNKPKSTNKCLSMAQREKDEDDFLDGLVIQDSKTFNTSIAVPPLASSASRIPQQRMTLNNNRAKEPPTKSPLVSRLARPSPLYQNGNKPSDHAAALAKKASSPNLRQQRMQQQASTTTTSNNTKHTFLAGTKASRQREAETATTQRGRLYKSASSSALRTTDSSHGHLLLNNKHNSAAMEPIEKKSANGYTLIARPKTKVTSYIARLDHIDNLNDLRPSSSSGSSATRGLGVKKSCFSLTSKVQQHPKGESKLDPDRPWRRNMQTTTSGSAAFNSRSRVKLIQPNEQQLKKEYNDMKYDDSTHCWKGNETSLIGFQEKPTFRRPMLISNRHQKSSAAPSRYAAVVGSSMIFNTDLQKWVSASNEEEFNELDTIEDLKDELLNAPSGGSHSHQLYNTNSNSGSSSNVTTSEGHNKRMTDNKLLDFKLSIEVKRQMMFEQEQHETFMVNWFPQFRQEEEGFY